MYTYLHFYGSANNICIEPKRLVSITSLRPWPNATSLLVYREWNTQCMGMTQTSVKLMSIPQKREVFFSVLWSIPYNLVFYSTSTQALNSIYRPCLPMSLKQYLIESNSYFPTHLYRNRPTLSKKKTFCFSKYILRIQF